VTSQALIAGEAKLASTSVRSHGGRRRPPEPISHPGRNDPYSSLSVLGLTSGAQPADLKGKRVAVSTFGSGSHWLAEVALHSLGLDPNRDKIAIMQSRNPAGSRGRVGERQDDATPLEPGFGQAAKDKGLTVMLDMTKADVPI